MRLFGTIQNFIEELSERQFYRYLAILFGIVLIATGLVVYQQYRSVSHYKDMIKRVNRMRKEVQEILTEHFLVEKHRAQVDALLDENPDFNLQQYFSELATKFGMKSSQLDPRTIDRGQYFESIVRAKFSGITMQLLTELLQALEQNARITNKELDITQGKGDTIDVDITVATLKKKNETVE